jgi:hypothetical protein
MSDVCTLNIQFKLIMGSGQQQASGVSPFRRGKDGVELSESALFTILMKLK